MEKRIPAQVFQGETNECGLACIAMLADTQGVDAPLRALRERYPASERGTSLATLCDILNDMQIPVYPVTFAFNELEALPLPAILHYGASHYVLLAWRKGRYVCVMNPALGQQLLPLDALRAQISGYALVLDEEATLNESILSARRASKRLRAAESMSLKETAGLPGIYGLMLCAFLISLTLFIMPTMVSSAINQVFTSGGSSDFPYFWFLTAFVASTTLAMGLRVVTERFVKRFTILNSTAGFSRLLSNPLRFIDKRSPGEIFSRFSAWQMAAARKIELDNGLRTDWIIGAIALGLMCYVSPLLAAVSGVGVTLMGLVSVWAIYRDRYFTQQLQVKSAEQNDYILETLQGFSTIKSAGLDGQRKSAFARYTWALFTLLQKQKIYEQIKNSLYSMIGSIEMVLFMLLALPMLKEGAISLGEFFAYSFIRQIFTTYITRIFFSVLQKNQIHVIDTRAKDLFPLHSEDDALQKAIPPAVRFDYRLDYRSISFGYEAGRRVLSELSLTLRRGQNTAIIGESGAGKSTLLRIMAGLISPDSGEICADDVPINARQAHGLFFLQSQEDILFNASVLQNITLYDAGFDEKKQLRVDASLHGLNLTPVIETLPGGQNALIRESHAALSLGQRQRLLLARAMYSDKPVLVLDEPTANLDEATAHQVINTLLAHCREYGKTLITVTHSEAVLPMFDSVYRMESGRLVSGTAAPRAVSPSLLTPA